VIDQLLLEHIGIQLQIQLGITAWIRLIFELYEFESNLLRFDDNGSGVAVLLEVARVLTSSKQPDGQPCFTPDFTIIFVAFDSEEPGKLSL